MSATMKLNAEKTTLTSAVNFRYRACSRSRAQSVSASIGHLAHERNHFSALRHTLAHERGKIRQTEQKTIPAGAVAKLPPQGRQPQHATSGKKIRKKDLGMIAKSYGYVYVAHERNCQWPFRMGASQAQYFKVIKEAEAYHGPSLIICYAPCINHGIKIGMGRTQCRRLRTPYKSKIMKVSNEEKLAVECGYWHLWHFNPAEEDEGKNGFHLDSKEPDWSKFRDFIMGEVRYNSLMKTFPQEAEVPKAANTLKKKIKAGEQLFAATERNAKLRYEGYKKLSEM